MKSAILDQLRKHFKVTNGDYTCVCYEHGSISIYPNGCVITSTVERQITPTVDGVVSIVPEIIGCLHLDYTNTTLDEALYLSMLWCIATSMVMLGAYPSQDGQFVDEVERVISILTEVAEVTI